MIDFVIIVIVAALVGSALAYIIKAQKKGKCVGCPYSKGCGSAGHTEEAVSGCSGNCKSCSGCGCHTNVK